MRYAWGFFRGLGGGSVPRGVLRFIRWYGGAQLRWLVSDRPDRPTLRTLTAETIADGKRILRETYGL